VRLKSIQGRVLKKLYWDLRVALATVRQQSMTVTFKGEFRLSAKNKYLIFGFTVLVLFLELTAKASADSAKEQLQGTMDRVIEVLQTIRSAEDIERNKGLVRQILLTRFDFAAMAEKSLGDRWKDLNGKEGEFVSAFTNFIEQSYMGTLGSYRGEKIVYDRDRADRELAEVDTRVVGGRGAPIEIDYKLHLIGGQWKVYDVVIEDVSVVRNYRSQFMRILQTASLEELIQKLRTKASGR
jgi:phospholipid transport system substrate-binding protein